MGDEQAQPCYADLSFSPHESALTKRVPEASVNRQYKRMMKREEQRKAATPRPQPRPAGPAARRERTRPRDFLREVVAELRKVAWPTRQEVAAYSLVVLVSVVVIAAVIFVMDFVFTKAVLTLFGVDT